MKFTAAIKTKWLKALRSGKYKQANEALYDADLGGYCCLGVLGKVQGVTDAKLLSVSGAKYQGYGTAGTKATCLPAKLREALGEMNDSGKSFKFIANYIEKNIPAVK